MTRRHFLRTATFAPLAATIPLALTSCSGEPTAPDPQIFWGLTPRQAEESARLQARDIPNGQGIYRQVQPTGSMRPLIDDYDWIVWVTPGGAPYESLIAGHVVLYVPQWDPAKFVCHRLRQRDRYGWVVSGDNVRPIIDPETGRNLVSEASYRVTAQNYHGRVVGVHTTRARA